MTRMRMILAAGFLSSTAFGPPVSGAEGPASPDVPPAGEKETAAEKKKEPLEQRVEELDKRQQTLERRIDVVQAAREAEAKAAVPVAGPQGFVLATPSRDFQLRFRFLLDADGRFFIDENPSATNQFLLRRVWPIFDGTVCRWLDFRLMPDFAEGKAALQDAYGEFRYWDWARLRVGKFKMPVGLERLQSAQYLTLIERGLPSDLLPLRDVGAQVGGDLLDGAFSYAAGIFAGSPDGTSEDVDTNDDKDLAARIFVQPFRPPATRIGPLEGLGLGIGGTYGNEQGTAPPSYKTTTQNPTAFFSYFVDDKNKNNSVVADGDRYRITPQGFYYWGPFSLLAEYADSTQKVSKGAVEADEVAEAWQVSGAYILTGEKASYRGFVPRNPFDPRSGQWGGFQVAARYSELKMDLDAFRKGLTDPKAQRRAREWTVGLNWVLTENFQVMLDYSRTSFQAVSGNKDRATEDAVLCRFQIYF